MKSSNKAKDRCERHYWKEIYLLVAQFHLSILFENLGKNIFVDVYQCYYIHFNFLPTTFWLVYIGRCPPNTIQGVLFRSTFFKSFSSQVYCLDPGLISCSELIIMSSQGRLTRKFSLPCRYRWDRTHNQTGEENTQPNRVMLYNAKFFCLINNKMYEGQRGELIVES